MPDSDVFRRPISPIEWWFTAYPADLTSMTQILVEGTGHIDPRRLTDAVEIASAACPGARLVRDGLTWVDSGSTPPVRVVDGTGVQLPRLPQLHTLLAAPMCEVVLVDGPVTTVAFRANHAVMDAKGLVLWALDVFRVLRGEEPLGARDPISDRDVATEQGTVAEPVIPAYTRSPVLGQCGPTHRSRAVSGRLSLQGTFPGLVARLATALTGSAGGVFAVPVDLRPHRPGVRTTANMTTSIDLTVTAGESWEEVHERLLRMLADGEATQAGPPADTLFSLSRDQLGDAINAVDRATRDQGYPVNAILSHAGRIACADVSAPGFAAYTGYELSRPVPGGAPELALVEVDGRTEITVSWWDGPTTAARIAALLDRIEEELSPRQHWAGNHTARPLPDDASVVELFARQAEATPDAIALDGPEGPVTYAELAHRSAVVAADLLARGVGPDTVVGVLADRTVAAMTAIWGVLRAGGAYLPLDGHLPDARITDLLTEAGAPVCLVQRPHDERDVLPAGCEGVIIEALDFAVATPELDVTVAPGDLAYVIYTSGSTGRPKGVEIEHAGIANYVHWALREYRIDADTRLPLIVSLSFDLAGNGVYLPLMAGGTVILWPDDVSHTTLRALLTQTRANALSLTPAHLDLIGRLDLAPRGFRSIVVIGEQLRRSVAVRAQRMFGPDCEIINSYGPTEATIGMTTHPFDEHADTAPVVPIGVPTDNSTVFLLDSHDRFTTGGEPGEMCLGGVQLARGYRGRPDLDHRRFGLLADGTRVYRTGDIARLLPTGELEFVGRTDDQVKVLGHRIEPAEIAQALETHDAVGRAVVVARSRPGQSHKTLCAYVVGVAEVTVAELDEHVARLLPAYMVPAVTLFVDGIPQSSNGKVDVRGLPDPFERETHDVSGRDELASAVAGIWSHTLGLPPDQIADGADFHQLGGNSILLLSMMASVSADLVGAEREARFMTALGRIIREPTLDNVTDIVRKVRA